MLSDAIQGLDDAACIDRVSVNDGCDKVEGACPNREVILDAITEAAEAMEVDDPHQAVAAFPFAELCRYRLSQITSTETSTSRPISSLGFTASFLARTLTVSRRVVTRPH